MRKVIVSTYVTQLFTSDAILLGLVTYQGFAAAWPSGSGDDTADSINSLLEYVASTTLEEIEWNDSSLIEGNISEEVFKLKQQPGKDILMYGSAELMHALMQDDLIDEYRIWVTPGVLGSGKLLFRDGSGATVLRLVGTTTFDSGAVVLSCQPAEN